MPDSPPVIERLLEEIYGSIAEEMNFDRCLLTAPPERPGRQTFHERFSSRRCRS